MGAVPASRRPGRAVRLGLHGRCTRPAVGRGGHDLVAGAPLGGDRGAEPVSATAVSSVRVTLPRAGGHLELYELGPPAPFAPPDRALASRTCLAAAHVVRDPLADVDPHGPAQLDWGATLAYRRHLW